MAVLANGDFKRLTREEAIELHRELWHRLAEEGSIYDVDTLYKLTYSLNLDYFDTKHRHIKEMGFKDIMCDCFLCDYALSELKDTGSNTKIDRCKYCPLRWPNKTCIASNYDEDMTMEDIRDLPEKEV